MKHIFLTLAVVLSVGLAQAGLQDNFEKIESTYKGPFSLNYLQGSQGRVAIKESSATPPGTFQFQAAFRNDTARAMAEQDNFYMGNLFTTNYYELTGRYVYNDPYGSFALDHKAMAAAAPLASDQVASIVRNWVLEKSYITFLPHSVTAKSFRLRGISGAEFEYEYAFYFFNFALTAVSGDFQFLPLFLLAKTSPLTDAAALDRARTMVAELFDAARLRYGEKDSSVRDLYAIRNSIHNQISPNVVGQISNFLNKYPGFSANFRKSLVTIQDIVRNYYNVGPQQIIKLAKTLEMTSVINATQVVADEGFSAQRALDLSNTLTDVRTQLAEKSLPYEKRAQALVLLATAAQYLNKELSALENPAGKEPLLAVLNLLYVEGFLIRDNWDYFRSEISTAGDTSAAIAMIPDLVEIATDTLTQAFTPALDQWISLEPKMQYFMDNTIKSSSLNTASILAKNVK
jgi:hypothetical protein